MILRESAALDQEPGRGDTLAGGRAERGGERLRLLNRDERHYTVMQHLHEPVGIAVRRSVHR